MNLFRAGEGLELHGVVLVRSESCVESNFFDEVDDVSRSTDDRRIVRDGGTFGSE